MCNIAGHFHPNIATLKKMLIIGKLQLVKKISGFSSPGSRGFYNGMQDLFFADQVQASFSTAVCAFRLVQRRLDTRRLKDFSIFVNTCSCGFHVCSGG